MSIARYKTSKMFARNPAATSDHGRKLVGGAWGAKSVLFLYDWFIEEFGVLPKLLKTSRKQRKK